MKAKKFLSLFFTLICLSVPAMAWTCACCAEPGQYSISTRKPGAAELEILRDLRFSTANLFTNAAYPDNIKGINPLGENYFINGAFQNRVWRLNFKDDKNRTGMLEIPLSATMVEYMADIFDRQENSEPILYKEWRFKFRVSRGTGIFQRGLGGQQPASEYFLVLQGKGNNCTSAQDFHKWRLEITGKKASYAFYGKL